MAQLIITVPDAQVARVLAAFAAQYGYQDTVPGANPGDPPVANPETRVQFTRRMLRRFVMEVVRANEVVAAIETARTDAAAKVDAEIALT